MLFKTDDFKGTRTLLQSTKYLNTSLVIFIHGFGQTHFSSWSPLTSYLESHADDNPPFKGWDFFFFGYDSAKSANFLKLAALLNKEIDDASQGSGFYNRPYERLSLIGFSLGSIVIRQYLVACIARKQSLWSLHSITLFNAPLQGSTLGWLSPVAPLFRRSSQLAKDLRPGSTALSMLQGWTECAYAHHAWPAPNVYYGAYDPVCYSPIFQPVTWAGDRNAKPLPTNHDIQDELSIPNGRAYQAIRDALE